MTVVSGFADISIFQLLLVAAMALFASIIGGLAGYSTGALMPLVLVPLVDAEPVVPIIAISAIFTNLSPVIAYLRYAERRRAAGLRSLASSWQNPSSSGCQCTSTPRSWTPPLSRAGW